MTTTDSILDSVKSTLAVPLDDDSMDTEIMLHINSVFGTLHAVGVGPDQGFEILDNVPTWNDYTNYEMRLNPVKSYMYLKVKLLFDPPANYRVVDSMEKQFQEYEWRLSVIAETIKAGGI